MASEIHSNEQRIWNKIRANKTFQEIVNEGYSADAVSELMELHLRKVEKSMKLSMAVANTRGTEERPDRRLNLRCLSCDFLEHSIDEAKAHLDRMHPIEGLTTKPESEKSFERNLRFWKWFITYYPQEGSVPS